MNAGEMNVRLRVCLLFWRCRRCGAVARNGNRFQTSVIHKPIRPFCATAYNPAQTTHSQRGRCRASTAYYEADHSGPRQATAGDRSAGNQGSRVTGTHGPPEQ